MLSAGISSLRFCSFGFTCHNSHRMNMLCGRSQAEHRPAAGIITRDVFIKLLFFYVVMASCLHSNSSLGHKTEFFFISEQLLKWRFKKKHFLLTPVNCRHKKTERMWYVLTLKLTPHLPGFVWRACAENNKYNHAGCVPGFIHSASTVGSNY